MFYKRQEKGLKKNAIYLQDQKPVVVQINSMATQQNAHVLEGSLLAIDVVRGGIVFASSSGNTELAVGDNFEVIPFLERRGEKRGEGHKHQSSSNVLRKATQML